MKENNLVERLLNYSAEIVRLVESLPNSVAGRRIGDQLLRSGTAVGANYEEAQAGESKADFIHKLQISLKELRESNYWLRLLAKTQLVPHNQISTVLDESNQLKAILSKAVATAKGKSKTNEERQR